MSIQDDIETLKTMQEDFRTAHGEYFEIIYDKSKLIPDEGDDLNITSLTRFLQPADVNTSVKSISFTPTAKDFQFIVGKGTYKDSDGKIVGRVYMITARRRLQLGGIIEHYKIWGGDSPYKENED